MDCPTIFPDSHSRLQEMYLASPRLGSSEYDSEVLYFCGTVSSGTYCKSLRKRMEQRDEGRGHIKHCLAKGMGDSKS